MRGTASGTQVSPYKKWRESQKTERKRSANTLLPFCVYRSYPVSRSFSSWLETWHFLNDEAKAAARTRKRRREKRRAESKVRLTPEAT
jgi:hypothetical protein